MFCLGQYKPTINRKLMYVNKLDFSSSQHFQLGNLKGKKNIHDKNVKVCLTTDLQYIFFLNDLLNRSLLISLVNYLKSRGGDTVNMQLASSCFTLIITNLITFWRSQVLGL